MPAENIFAAEQQETGLEVTPAMVEAGFWALLSYDSETGDPREKAVEVYKLMAAARGSAPSTS